MLGRKIRNTVAFHELREEYLAASPDAFHRYLSNADSIRRGTTVKPNRDGTVHTRSIDRALVTLIADVFRSRRAVLPSQTPARCPPFLVRRFPFLVRAKVRELNRRAASRRASPR